MADGRLYHVYVRNGAPGVYTKYEFKREELARRVLELARALDMTPFLIILNGENQ